MFWIHRSLFSYTFLPRNSFKRVPLLAIGLVLGISCLKAQQESSEDTVAMFFDLDDVVVTAQYAPTSSKNALQTIRTIDKTVIAQRGANNLEQLLNQDPNIRISQDQILGSGLSLLGVGGENIKIMIDGVPVVGRLDGNIDLSQINLSNVERVEIIEGPMSVNYGTDAIGGVINLITKKSQLLPLEITLNQQVESRAENSTSIDAGLRLNDQFLIRLKAGRDWFNGYSPDTSRSVLWNPKEQGFVDGLLRYDLGGDHSLRYQFAFFDEEVQNLGNVRRPQFKPYAFDDNYLTQRMNQSLNHQGSIGKHHYWQTTVGYNGFERIVDTYRHDFEENLRTNLGGDTTRFDTYMMRSVLASQYRDSKWNYQLGADLRYEQGAGGRIFDESSTDPTKSDIGDYALFGSLRYQANRDLSMEAGLRASYNSRFDVPLIPSFHLKYSWSDALTLRASYGRGFRSPSLKELFLEFIDLNHFILGNPNLAAETSNNFQVHLNWAKNIQEQQWSGQIGLFYNQIQDQIQLFPYVEQNGELVPAINETSTSFAYFNLERSEVIGGRLNLNYQYRSWQLGLGYTRLGLYNPESETFSAVPRFTFSNEWNARFALDLPWWSSQLNVFGRFNDRFISYFPTVENGLSTAQQQIQDGFTMIDASWVLPLYNKRLNLSFGVRNLLDIQQVGISGGSGGVHASGNNFPVGPGRSFFVRASLRLFDNQAAKFKNPTFEEQEKEAFSIQKEPILLSSWIETQNNGEQVFQFSKRKEGDWTTPKTIQIGQGDWFVNDLDAPQVAAFPNNHKQLLAFWLAKIPSRNAYDHHLMISRSKNGGKSWSKPMRPYDSEVPAFYGFGQLHPLSNGRILLSWMDGRETKVYHEASDRYHPSATGKLTLRSVEIDEKGKRYQEHRLTNDVSPLCPYTLLNWQDKPTLIYRDAENNIQIRNYLDQQWRQPKMLSTVEWKRKTTAGPVACIVDQNLAVAWYDITEDANKIHIQLINEKMELLQQYSIKAENSTGKIDLAFQAKDNQLLIASNEGQQLVVYHLNLHDGRVVADAFPLLQQSILTKPIITKEEGIPTVVFFGNEQFNLRSVKQ